MRTRDGRDVKIEDLTPENYLVPKGEEGFYHAVIEVRQFDTKTGARISRPRVQKFGKKTFETLVRDSLMKQGYEVLILHNPKTWLEEQSRLKAEKQQREREEKAKAEQERFDNAVAAAVAKILAEQGASGSTAPKTPGRRAKNE